MGILDVFKSSKQNTGSPTLSFYPLKTISEQTKTATVLPEKQFPQGLGIDHPYDFAELEKWYKDDPFVHGVVEKHVDFIMGGGFHVTSEVEAVQNFVEQKMREFQFQTLLRNWIRRALISNGYLEIQYDPKGAPIGFNLLDAKYIYIKLKKKDGKLTNEIENYNQFIDLIRTPQPIPLKEKEVAHLAFNRVNDSPYGLGIIQPLTFTLNKKVNFIQDFSTMVHRKAVAKLLIKLGDRQTGKVPPDDDVKAFGQRIESMTNMTDLITGPYVETETINFGDMGKNFADPLRLVNEELIYGSQVPHVLMGIGNVAEGLADAQSKSWMFRIRSLQEEIEKVIETKIFAPLLEANSFNPEDIEFEWGSPSPDEKREDIKVLQSLLGSSMLLSPEFRTEIETRLRELLEFEEGEFEQPDPMEQQQPFIGPGRVQRPKPEDKNEKKEEKPKAKEHVHEVSEKNNITIKDSLWEVPLNEYVGFNYRELIEKIKQFIDSDDFVKRKFKTFEFKPGTDQEDWEVMVSRYNLNKVLSKEQVEVLREVLKDGFDKNKSIVQIKQEILEKVKPEPLTLDNGAVLDADTRSTVMARTETVRATNEGLLRKLEEDGIERVQWLASAGSRTCPFCDDMNGKILSLSEAQESIPVHASCRCTWAAIRG